MFFQGGQRLLTIVPRVGLAAEVFIPNKDIGFVKPGQKARVRVDAFPFTKYGEISATVASIGASSLPPDETSPLYRFPLSLDLSKSNLQFDNVSIPLRSGMSITVNLKLRDKSYRLLSDILVDQTDAVKVSGSSRVFCNTINQLTLFFDTIKQFVSIYYSFPCFFSYIIILIAIIKYD